MTDFLLYDQFSSTDSELPGVPGWNPERVCSISETINHPFFRSGMEENTVLVIHPGTIDREVAEFILYIKRYWPTMEIIIVLPTRQDFATWRGLLKGTEIKMIEKVGIANHLEYFLMKPLNT